MPSYHKTAKHQKRGRDLSYLRCIAMIEFFVPGKPMAKERPRATRAGNGVRMYTPAKTVSYESTVALFAKSALGAALPIARDIPLAMTLIEVFAVPASWSRKKRAQALDGELFPTVKPDIDNVSKIIADALNTIVYVDDSQIVQMYADKRYGEVPGVIVNITQAKKIPTEICKACLGRASTQRKDGPIMPSLCNNEQDKGGKNVG
jgi:Holliday junction resolvase RusA-like endonuclease